MDYSKPTLLVISGPNGAGKSTHIQSMLPFGFAGINSFDRDRIRTEFEQQLKIEGALSSDQIQLKAMRLMEDQLVLSMDQAIRSNSHFVLETPLSHPDYWKYIDRFEKNGYQVQLNYLCLDKVRDCSARVEQRVMEGGHYVDPRTIRGVYETNLKFINDFNDTFKVIELYDGMQKPRLLARMEGHQVYFATQNALKKKWIRIGLPSIAQKISEFLKNNQI
jgi:predicted ABC-type ATPase